MHMSHVVEIYLKEMHSDVEREKFLERLTAPDSIVNDSAGLLRALEIDYLAHSMTESNPQELNDRRIAFVACLTMIASFAAIVREYRNGKRPSQWGTSKSGGASG